MEPIPTRLSAATFATKAAALRARRAIANLRHPIPRYTPSSELPLPFIAAQSITALWTDDRSEEQWHQRGKVANLSLAATQIHRCRILSGQEFSFWRQVGKPSGHRGFQLGRMLQEGCMVPSVGGGLCQLSNALYQVALDSGCQILERHRHSRLVPGSATAAGRDATVAWNYIDLRFRARTEIELQAEVTDTHMLISILSATASPRPRPALEHLTTKPAGDDHACDTCGATACFRKH
jgi:vancomycin resistance protein YoaR